MEKPPAHKTDYKSTKKRSFLWFFAGCVLLVLVLAFGTGVGFGIAKWDTITNWYQENFVSKQSSQEQEDSDFKDAISIVEGEEFNIETKGTLAVEKVSPAVVSVAKSNVRLGQSGVSEYSSSIGTGFVIDARNGIVLTNMHVVSSVEDDYTVVGIDGESYDVTKIYGDDAYDLALLEVDFGDSDIAVAEFGNSDLLKVGEAVIAIGNPLGNYPGTVTQGIVSGLNRQVEAGDALGRNVRVYDDVIQTDSAINFGNSGGPLLNLEGQVIGVNFGKASGSGAEGISFAIPINKVKERIGIFNQHGYFPRPYIGVQYSMIDEITATMYKVPSGAFVERVVSGSPAQEAGVKRGDIITEINGEKLTRSLFAIIQEHEIGEAITLKIWRPNRAEEDAYIEVKLTLEDAGSGE